MEKIVCFEAYCNNLLIKTKTLYIIVLQDRVKLLYKCKEKGYIHTYKYYAVIMFLFVFNLKTHFKSFNSLLMNRY